MRTDSSADAARSSIRRAGSARVVTPTSDDEPEMPCSPTTIAPSCGCHVASAGVAKVAAAPSARAPCSMSPRNRPTSLVNDSRTSSITNATS